MLTATLIKPARLNAYGIIWERGVAEPVDLAMARMLHGNKRFQIDGLLEALESAAAGAPVSDESEFNYFNEDAGAQTAETGRPSDRAELLAAIREAADELDVDDEEAFTAAGKPAVPALEKLLGYDITAEERDAAISGGNTGKLETATQTAPAATAQKPAEQKPAPVKGGVKIKKAVAKPAEKDASTEGAVEV